MTTVVYTASGWVPLAGVPAGPGPDPEDPKVPPPAVIILSATSPSPTELRVTWLAPTDPNAGGSIVAYQIDLDGEPYDYSHTTTQVIIGDLDPDTEHTITVRALNNFSLVGPDAQVTGRTQVEVPTSNFPAVWDAMIASRDLEVVRQTFATYTGYQAAGYSLADLTPGSGDSVTDGQVIEGRIITRGRWAHNNVTYRGCLIQWSGSLYGAYGNPTFSNPYTGIVFENCTFVGPAEAPTARRAGVISATHENAVTFRYCNFSGGTSGVANDSAAGGAVIEYCWVHDLAASNESNNAHRTSLRTTAGGGRFYRNYCTDGGSSCISAYFDKNPISNFEIRENVLDGSSPNANPSYLITMKEGPYTSTATGFTVVDNYLGPHYQYGLINGAGIPWGTAGNEMSGNTNFLTGDPID